MHASDLIEINAIQTEAAVVLDRNIANPNLVACFTPSQSIDRRVGASTKSGVAR